MGIMAQEGGIWKDRSAALRIHRDGAWMFPSSVKAHEDGAWVEKLGTAPYGLYVRLDSSHCASISGSGIWFAAKYSSGMHWARITVETNEAHPVIELDEVLIMGLPSEIQESAINLYTLKKNITGDMTTTSYKELIRVFGTNKAEFLDNFSWTPSLTYTGTYYIALQYWFNGSNGYNPDYYGQVLRAYVSGFRINGRTVIGSASAGDTSLL